MILILYSFKIKEIYIPRTENKNLKQIKITVVDEKENPKSGDSIEVRIIRYPIFSIQESHKIIETISDKNGNAFINLSQNHNYIIYVFTPERAFNSLDIDSTDIRIKDHFLITE